MTKALILVLGGARSGKSAFAQELAKGGHRVLFAATAEPGDSDMAERIVAHRRQCPSGWDTLEEPMRLPEALAQASPAYDTVVVDCLTLWVSNLMLKGGDAGGQGVGGPVAEARRLLDVYERGSAT